MSEVKSVVVDEDEFQVWGEEEGRFVINAPSNFYVIIATGSKVFYLTKDRSAAQHQADLDWGKGKYTIRAIKDVKSKSKMESGGLSVRGVATRRGQKKYN